MRIMYLKFSYSIFLLILILCLISCIKDEKENQLNNALELSGKNKSNLNKVLAYYKQDSLKLEAAKFLIRNMPYHYFMDEYYLSPNGAKYRPDISLFSNTQEVEKYCDSLINCGYKIKRRKIYDIEIVDSNYLIENIELAFIVWRKPWAKTVSFNDFCRYILPYRSQNEKLSSLRRKIIHRFIPLLDSAKVNTPLEACVIINKQLEHIIKYKNINMPFYPTIEETYHSGIGKCEGICNLGAFFMRAVGIPTAIDCTIWPKMDLGHSWCSVLSNGVFYGFDPGERQPVDHVKAYSTVRHRIPAKVYRTEFKAKSKKYDENYDQYQTFLKSPLLYDVTNSYYNKTTNIQFSIDENTKEAFSNPIYLCTHNYRKWTPLAIGVRTDTSYTFSNIVGDNVFIIADCPDGKALRYISAPFYVDIEGKIQKFIPNTAHHNSIIMKKIKNKSNIAHVLFYWNVIENRFVPLSYNYETESELYYDNIPDNALLWFMTPGKIYNQRIFFIENNKIRKY